MPMKIRFILILFCVNAAAAHAQTITLAPITKLVYCIGDTLTVSYFASGNFDTGNVFIAELSDDNGSFQTPTTAGSSFGDTGSFQIPLANSGPGYRVRVISIAPSDSSADNGKDISVSNFPIPSAFLVIGPNRLAATASDSTGGPAVMVGQLAQFAAIAFPSANMYYWTFNEDASQQYGTGTTVSVSYPTVGLKDGLLNAVNAGGCESTIAFSFRVLDCEQTIPWYSTVVTDTESVADSFVWVKPGGVDSVAATPYPQTIFVETDGSVITTSDESWNTYYIKPGGSIHPLPEQGTVVFSMGNRDTIAANARVDTLSCDDLEFQVSSGVRSEVPQPAAFRIIQNGDKIEVLYEYAAFTVRMLNPLGAEIFSERGSGALDIDLSMLPAGVYFAVAQAGDEREVYKIAVIH
jgi:hypothetical protein